MKLRIRRHKAATASIALMLLAISLSGCGSRLTNAKVVAENADLGGTSTRTPGVGGNTGSGGFSATGSPAGSDTTTPTTSGASANGTTASPGGTTSGNAGTSGGGSNGGVSSSASPTDPGTLSTVNVGQIGTDSGLVGTILGYSRTGAEIWAQYINQHGGLNGHPVNLITADDGGNPSTGLSEAQTMVQQDHVIAFLANSAVLSTPTIAPYLQQVGVPTIGGTDIESEWYTNPDFYPEGSSVRIWEDGAAKNGINEGHTKVGILYCVEFALICSNVDSLMIQDMNTLGGQTVYNEQISLAQPDFTSECLSARAAGVTNLVVLADINSWERLATDCDNQDFHPYYAIAGLEINPNLIATSTIGMVGAAGSFPFMVVSPATAQFDAAVKEATGQAPVAEFEASAWVAGLILQTAASKLSASNPTAAQVVAGLDQIRNDNFGGLTSPLTFTQGQPTPTPTCYYPIVVVQGGFSAPDGLQPQCLPSSLASGPQ